MIPFVTRENPGPKDEQSGWDRTLRTNPVNADRQTLPTEGRDAYLKAQSGSMIGRLFRLDKERMVLGRADTNEVVLREDGVSRRHATIVRTAAGFVLHDGESGSDGTFKPSTNGVYVNGERVTEHLLHAGDRIQLGSSNAVLRFQLLDAIDVQAAEDLFSNATRDGLTGAFKKEYFAEQLRTDFAFASRRRQPLSLVVLDVDFFKKLNDGFGHLAGDHVLKSLARLITDALRTEDVFARWGGEEFAILLRDTDEERAVAIAERIRKRIEDYAFIFEVDRLPVTVSMGVATHHHGEANRQYESTDQLFKAADTALYAAKHGGRNRVVASGPISAP